MSAHRDIKLTSELDGLINLFIEKRGCYPAVIGYLRYHLNSVLLKVEAKYPEMFNELSDSLKKRTKERIEELNEEDKEKVR